jgi:LPXTG-motif cell wall-anchored protein
VKRLFAAVTVAGVVWLAPMGAEATKQPTTTTSTTSTTTSTTVVEPSTTQPSTTPTVPGAAVRCPDPANPYPQNYGKDAPCGPTDPCIDIDPATGMGTTLWTIQRCGTPVTTVAPTAPATSSPSPAVTSVSPPVLPATGGETGWIALAALVTLLTGISVVAAARRSS